MTVIPTLHTTAETSALKLARYVQILGLDECGFWGVVSPSGTQRNCRTIWTLQQRSNVARSLAEAQVEIEQIVGYPVGLRWITELKREYRCPSLTKYGYVIQGGVRAVSVIAAGAAVNHATDPAVVGPIGTTVTDEDEIKVYHPGTDVEIDPSKITIAGGTVTIEIPRCRMVTTALANNPEAGLSYSTISNFEATVDVKRVYNDPSTNANLYSNHQCNSICAQNGCTDTSRTACIYVADPIIGRVEVLPGSYSSSWVAGNANALCCNSWRYMQLNYQAGKLLDSQMEDTIIRLAHSKMAQEPCGCDPAKWMWMRDRNVPTVLTAERLNCPFGLSDGAYTAWKFALSMALGQGGTIV